MKILFVLLFFSMMMPSFGNNAYQVNRSIYIVGGGVVGLLEAYHAYDEARQKNETIDITILEKNKSIKETPASNIFPSLTPDEILSVIPRGKQLIKDLQIKFNVGDGIRIDDVPSVDIHSKVSQQFIQSVERFSKDEQGYQVRVDTLIGLGKYSMASWQKFYENADDELKAIMLSSNYKPCREVSKSENRLGQGYRIDVVFKDADAKGYVTRMQDTYQKLGYTSTRLLQPDEVTTLDPQLANFVEEDSSVVNGRRQWNKGSAAIWRPGGCINAYLFLPKLVSYLEKHMVDSSGKNKKPLFRILYGHKVVGVNYADVKTIKSLTVEGRKGKTFAIPESHDKSKSVDFIFAPGEAVGTLRQLGFKEPDHAIFAGPSLTLGIDIPPKKIGRYTTLNHCMEVHQSGRAIAL